MLITNMTVRSGNLSCTGNPDVIEPILTQGIIATICIDVKNQGNRAAGPFVVEWNPDAFGLITPSPGTLSQQVNGLGVNQSTTVRFYFTYHQHGEFRTVAKADAFNNVAELNEANNLSIVNVVVEPANIDLVITSFTVSPKQGTDIIRGSKAMANITVKNNGTYPTGPFSLQWKITGEDGSGPFARISGLQPSGQAGDSQSVQLEGVFYIAGPYTSMAVADVFDEVIETNENNNTKTFNVTVKPRQTVLRVTFNSVKVKHALKQDWDLFCTTNSYGRWYMGFAIVDPNASDGYQLYTDSDYRRVDDDGQILNYNKSFNVTLTESYPLVLGAGGIALTSGATLLGCYPDGANFAGFTAYLWTYIDRWGEGTFTIPTIPNDKEACSDGCFELTYTVDVLSAPPPFAGLGEPVESVPEVTLPAGMANSLWIPPGAQLPPGVLRILQVYLPLILTH